MPKTKNQHALGNIDFMAARKAFKRAQRHVVITGVDKAANCLCVMCKACYKSSYGGTEWPGM